MTIKDWIAIFLSFLIMIALFMLCDILFTAIPYVILLVVDNKIAIPIANWTFFFSCSSQKCLFSYPLQLVLLKIKGVKSKWL